MKKRLIVLGLTLAIASSLVVPAYASNNSTNVQVERDMEAMKNAFLNVDAISVSSVNEDGLITYAYELTKEVTDFITVRWNEDGSALLDIWEEDRNDTITVLTDGTLLFDGEYMSFSSVDSIDNPGAIGGDDGIMASGRFEYYFSSMPHLGTPSSYTVGPSTTSNPNVAFSEEIRKKTGAVIGAALAAELFPGNAAAANKLSDLFGELGVQLRSRAEAQASNSNMLSYKASIYGHPQSDSFKTYRRYYNRYYIGPNYIDPTPTVEVFYEYRVYT